MSNACVGGRIEKTPALILGAMIGMISVACGMIPFRFVLAIVAGLVIAGATILWRDKRTLYLALLVFCMPINVNKALYKIPGAHPYLSDTLALYAVDIILAILYGMWIYDAARSPAGTRRKAVLATFVSLPLLGMACAAVLSLVNAESYGRSFIEIYYLARGALIYLYLINAITSMREVSIVAAAIAVGAILQSAIVLLQTYLHAPLGLLYFGEAAERYQSFAGQALVHRPAGLFEHPNLFANYLEFVVPLMLALAFVPKGRTVRVLATVALAGSAVALVLTLSRGGWIGSTVALACVFFLLARRALRERRFLVKTAVILCTAAVIGGVFAGKIVNRFTSRDAGSAKTRLLQFEVAKEIVASHPFAGVGINNYGPVMERYDETPSNVSRFFKLPIHNVYLLFLGETGIFGLAALLWLVAAIVGRGFAAIARADDDLYPYALGLTFGFVAYFIHIVVDMNYFTRVTTFWFMAALLTVVVYAVTGRRPLRRE